MRKCYIFLLVLLLVSSGYAQKGEGLQSSGPVDVRQADRFWVSKPMRDYPQMTAEDRKGLEGKIVPKDGVYSSQDYLSDKRKDKLEWIKSAGKSQTQVDPLLQGLLTKTAHNQRAPIASFDAINLQASPPDPSMAVGPNHVVAMENGSWAVYDKNGVIATGFPKTFDQTWGSSDGDPVVLYDREADRWMISQFKDPLGNSAKFLIGISQTPDPTGAYYFYEFAPGHGNDYPHFGIWGDSYVVAGNFTGASKVKTFNRTKMLAGDNTAEMAAFTPPGLEGSGFTAPMAVHSEAAGSATGPAKIVYYQDDAFNGVSTDHIGLWNINMDWSNINGSTISAKQEIPVTAFDAIFGGGFANIAQPGTSQRIDVIMGAVMNLSQWYKFSTYESLLLNWPVEINDGTQISGIRWVELRSTDNGATWSVHQEGTFTDPTGNESVWMGCISMDKQGNIGLGYTKSGNTTFPSLYYTGRLASEAAGTMGTTIGENLVIAGTTATSGGGAERYGDYGQANRDPNDDLTFWVVSEYSGTPRRVRVYSFKIGNDFNKDVGVTAINTPNNASGLTSSESVQVTLKNFGLQAQSNIPVELKLGGSTVATETYTPSLAPGATTTFTFSASVDLSTLGNTYSIEACTTLTGDEDVNNNCTTKSVQHLLADDVGVIAISSPNSGANLSNAETISITIQNFGGNTQSNIPVQFTVNGGTPVNGTIPGPLASGATVNYNFTGTADLSAVGVYNICSKTLLVGDQNLSNDELCKSVSHVSCVPTATMGCNVDGLKKFILGTIDADDGGAGCNTEPSGSPQGYANRTHMSTDLNRVSGSNIHVLQAQHAWTDQVDPPYTANAEKISVWIDFNDNATFEASEQLIAGESFPVGGQLVSFNLTVPTTANLGSHIMRVKVCDTTSSPGDVNDPCSDVAYGETHDYTVNIIDTTLSIDDNAFNLAAFDVFETDSGNFTVRLTSNQSLGSKLTLRVFNTMGQIIYTTPVNYQNGKYEYSLDLSTNASGVYVLTFGADSISKTAKIIVR